MTERSNRLIDMHLLKFLQMNTKQAKSICYEIYNTMKKEGNIRMMNGGYMGKLFRNGGIMDISGMQARVYFI